jgi:hypothetical protein
LTRGLSGITVAGFCDGGRFPNYHRMSDTADVVDYESAYKSIDFANSIMRRLASGLSRKA